MNCKLSTTTVVMLSSHYLVQVHGPKYWKSQSSVQSQRSRRTLTWETKSKLTSEKEKHPDKPVEKMHRSRTSTFCIWVCVIEITTKVLLVLGVITIRIQYERLNFPPISVSAWKIHNACKSHILLWRRIPKTNPEKLRSCYVISVVTHLYILYKECI